MLTESKSVPCGAGNSARSRLLAGSSRPEEKTKGPLAILAVGQDEQDRCVLRQASSRSGWALSTVGTVAEATRFLERHPTCVIFCNRHLPDGGWRDLSEAAASRGLQANVIVTSRLADDHLWAEVLNLGGYDVLATPLNASEVLQAVESASRSWRYPKAAAGQMELAQHAAV